MSAKSPYVPVDRNRRFIQCPRCGNTVFSADARFCRMCGLFLFNACSDQIPSPAAGCTRYNPGDARYCEQCGEPTSLLTAGLLLTWEELLETQGAVAAGIEPDYGDLDYDDEEGMDFDLGPIGS